MSQDTFYFPHDCKARHDRKLVNLIMKHGMTGVGIYWCLVEMLYEENGYLPIEYDRITFELRTNKDIVHSVVNDFELFKISENCFYSDSVLDRLQQRKDKSEKAKFSINKRWNKLEKDTNVIRPLSERNTIKERKEKESKEKHNVELPLDDVPKKGNKRAVIYSQETKESVKEIVDYLNTVTGKSFSPFTTTTIEHIHARLVEKRTIEDFKHVIDIKAAQWSNSVDYAKYLRPTTLFGTKFEAYLNETHSSRPDDKLDAFVMR